jgi:peptidoglycan/xylan/chitin deacetylase (PgdA/CDA1 family)
MRALLVVGLVACTGNKPSSIEVVVEPGTHLLHGDLPDHHLALTFDDGPEPTLTRRILATLAKHGVQATFFEVGRNAEANPDVTREIAEQGHSLGSHSWDHADLSTLSLDDAIANAERGHVAITGAAPFFRFPFFRSTDPLMTALHARGLSTFHANIVSEYHVTPDPDELLAKSLAAVEAEQRGIVIFHDIQSQTADMLDAFLDEIEARGYKTVVFRASSRL